MTFYWCFTVIFVEGNLEKIQLEQLYLFLFYAYCPQQYTIYVTYIYLLSTFAANFRLVTPRMKRSPSLVIVRCHTKDGWVFEAQGKYMLIKWETCANFHLQTRRKRKQMGSHIYKHINMNASFPGLVNAL